MRLGPLSTGLCILIVLGVAALLQHEVLAGELPRVPGGAFQRVDAP